MNFVLIDLYGNNKNKEKPVIMIKTDGTTCRYPSAQAAAKLMNIPQPNIVACLKGRVKTAGGYRWKYAERQSKKEENTQQDGKAKQKKEQEALKMAKKNEPDRLAKEAAAALAAHMTYGKWKAMQKPVEVVPVIPDGWRQCEYCGKYFKPRGGAQRFCDIEHRTAAYRERTGKKIDWLRKVIGNE